MEKFEFLRIFLSRKIMCCDRCDDDDICAVSPCSNRRTFVKCEIPSLENSTPPLNILSFRFPFPFPRTEKKKREKKKENKQNAETRNAISRILPILRLPLFTQGSSIVPCLRFARPRGGETSVSSSNKQIRYHGFPPRFPGEDSRPGGERSPPSEGETG